ncbi:MAG: tetratricopeptide repeat protein [Candidatus Eisenbacteria bacterium]|nr:tetratricopeptide repeat protein [Candidatus Eisenbacteria bacterium]
MKPFSQLLATPAPSAIVFLCVCALFSGVPASAQTVLGETNEPQAQVTEDERLNEARALIYNGRYDEGMAVLNSVLSEHPDSREALFLLATAYEWQDKLAEAQRVYRTIVSVNENDLEAWEQVAKLEAWQGRHEEAIALYGKLISRFGDRPSLLVGLARALSWANRLDEALLYYDRVLLQEPENPDALAGKAQVLRWTGDLRGARKVIRRAQSSGPSHPEVRREAEQIRLAMSPKVTVSYLESLEEDYLRLGGASTYNLGNRTWKAEADFFPELLESVSLDLWSSRDWEQDKAAGTDNYRVSSLGLTAGVGVSMGGLGSVGGSFTVREYQRYRENVLYPLHGDESRVQDFELWISGTRGAWTFGATLGTYPYFHKDERETPSVRKLEIGQQTVGRVQVGRHLTGTSLALVGCELGDYSEENDRLRVFGSVEGSPSGADWLYLRYAAYFQDFDSTSRDYFAPMNEFNHRLQARASRSSGRSFVSAGITLGQSHSSSFGDIFSVALSGFASRTLTQRWKVFVDGYQTYDDNNYSVGSIRVGVELTL